MYRIITSALVALSLCACNHNGGASHESASSDSTCLDYSPLAGEWMLRSFRIDCASTEFEGPTAYAMRFNAPDNTFSLSTDCNGISGRFDVVADTIRFDGVFVTEMACDNMQVEEAMLRMFADSTAYAICGPDTLRLVAPYIGTATFIKK